MDDGLGVSGSLQVKELLREVHVDLPHPAGHALPHFLHALRQRLVRLPPTTVRTWMRQRLVTRALTVTPASSASRKLPTQLTSQPSCNAGDRQHNDHEAMP